MADQGACATAALAPLANLQLPGDTSCPGSRIVGDPRLAPLAENGGPTPTLLPGPGSAAIDVLSGVPCPAVDQRVVARPQGGACDAGAVEVQPAALASGAGTGGPAALASPRRIGGVTLSRTAFRAKGKKPLGTTLGVRLTVASRIVLTVTKPAQGRRSKGACVAPTRRLSKARKCTRQVPLKGSIAKGGKAGLNRIAFSGKLRGRALAPGRYTFVITLPRVGAAKPVVATKAFRVLP
jgi:hypothetical protein